MKKVSIVPIYLMLFFLPLIVFGKIIWIDGLHLLNWKGNSMQIDFFTYYKSTFFLMMTSLAIIGMLLVISRKTIVSKPTKLYSLLFLYIVGCVASTVNSVYLPVSLSGFMEQFQGVFVLIGYALILIITYNVISDSKEIHTTTVVLAMMIIVASLIGMSQFFGLSIYYLKPVQDFVTLGIQNTTGFEFVEGIEGQVLTSTFYNPNFVGSFGALLLPLFSVLFIQSNGKWKKLSLLVVTIGLMFLLIGCESRAGYLGIFGTAILALISFYKLDRQKWKSLVVLFICFVSMFIGMNAYTGGAMWSEIERMNPQLEAERLKQDQVRFLDINFDNDKVSIVTNQDTFTAQTADAKRFRFLDAHGNTLLPTAEADGWFVFKDGTYSNYHILFSGKDYFTLNAYGREMVIFHTPEGLKMLGLGGQLNLPETPVYFKPLMGKEKLFSGRGYIWTASIPLLKDSLIVGSGPGTFPIVFPQKDYVGKSNMGTTRLVVDKPHNMYLQIAIENGIIAMLALVSVFIAYCVNSFQIYRFATFNTWMEAAGSGIFLGIVGYLIAGFFNDQMIMVAPIFYILLGIGMSINKTLFELRNDEVEPLHE